MEKKYGMAQIDPDRNANDVQIMDGGMFRLCDDQDWGQNENWCERMEIDWTLIPQKRREQGGDYLVILQKNGMEWIGTNLHQHLHISTLLGC